MYTSKKSFGGPAQPPDIKLPEPEAVRYFDAGKLDPKLLDDHAEAWAKKLASVSTSQLRRFYEHVTGLRRQIELESQGSSREEAFERLRADFKMLKAKAAYAHKRQGANFPMPFLQFVVNHVHAVNSANDFEAFSKHFQAVVGFHKFYAKEK